MDVTTRMSGLHGIDSIARRLAGELARGAKATSVAVYLAQSDETAYRLTGSAGRVRFARGIERAAIPSSVLTEASPMPLANRWLAAITTPALPSALGATIRWRAEPIGFIVLGPRRGATDYTAEDVDLLSRAAQEAAAAFVAARLTDAAGKPPRIATLDRSTAAVVHDLKNSVSALSLLARNAAGNIADPEFQRDALTTLSRTVERMQRALSRLSSPGVAPPSKAEPIDLQELIIEATTSLAVDTRVRLVRRLRPVSPVYGDRDALLRVVENLATNAAEAIDREGTVTVTLAEERGQAVISVADTGCGIAEEYQARHLFSPFRSTKKGGWGIGLYQTKQVVENQLGEILVESVEGHGTTFTVKLPLRADADSPSLESVR